MPNSSSLFDASKHRPVDASRKRKAPDQDLLQQQQENIQPSNSSDNYYTSGYHEPMRIIDHRPALDRVARWANSTYQSYTRQLSELLEPKHRTYANPEHSRRGFDGDERLHNLRRDLMGFQDVPIELQMKMV